MPNCPWREPYFSPPLSHISPLTDLICVIFIWIVYISLKNTIATKMGQNGAVLGQMPHFGPFPLKKISKRDAKKGGKSALTKYTFQNSGWFSIIKEVLLSCFGMKRGPGWGVVACNVKTQCQNLNCISVQTTGVVLLAPNFINHLVISYKHYLHQKSHMSGHLLSWPPLTLWCVFAYFFSCL